MTCYWSRGRTITKTREVADSCTTLHEGAPALAQIEGPDAHYHEFAEFAFAHENVIHMLAYSHAYSLSKHRFMADCHSRTPSKTLRTTSRNLEMDPWSVYDPWGNFDPRTSPTTLKTTCVPLADPWDPRDPRCSNSCAGLTMSFPCASAVAATAAVVAAAATEPQQLKEKSSTYHVPRRYFVFNVMRQNPGQKLGITFVPSTASDGGMVIQNIDTSPLKLAAQWNKGVRDTFPDNILQPGDVAHRLKDGKPFCKEEVNVVLQAQDIWIAFYRELAVNSKPTQVSIKEPSSL